MQTWADSKAFKTVHGLDMAYIERGTGAPTFVLLHGNPTSSYLWRDVIPSLEPLGRVIAPDLIGMGDSDKLPESGASSYTLAQHQRYLDGFLDAVLGDDEHVVLVIHDWGSALGFDWARRRPHLVSGIVYMESIVRPLSWDEWPRGVETFKRIRTAEGERMMLADNVFVEQRLPAAVLRTLTEHEMAEYRRPFLEAGEDRRPTLTWARQIPLGGEPIDVVETVQRYADWLETSTLPKLFINAEPGGILVGAQREFCRGWPNQTEVTVPGIHYIQEDSGGEIGQAIAEWATRLRSAPKPEISTST